jgi:hypothetical protein
MGDSGQPLTITARIMLAVWCILLVPWAFIAIIGSGMVFEGGQTFDAYLALVVMWSFPFLVATAYNYRRTKPWLVWLPLLTGLFYLIEETIWKPAA